MVLIVVAIFISFAGNAASFDCRKSASYVEKLICADQELSRLDDTLEEKYRAAMRRSKENKDLVLEQRSWLAERNICHDRECLIRAYWSRLAELQNDYTAPEKVNCDAIVGDVDWERCSSVHVALSPEYFNQGYCMQGAVGQYIQESCPAGETKKAISRTKVTMGNQTFCRALLASEYTLIDLSLPHSISADEASTHLNLRAATTEIYEYAGYFDINNDGNPENIGWIKAYSGAGSGCDVEQYVQLDQKRAHIADTTLTTTLSEHNCRDYYRAVRYQGNTYLVNHRTVHIPSYGFVGLLKEVLFLKGNTRRSVCRFTYNND